MTFTVSGCGQGKYLNVNPSVFNIGADKCCRLTKMAKDKDNEVDIYEFFLYDHVHA